MADEATSTTEGVDETSADTDTSSTTTAETSATEETGEAALGDAGKKALDAMKAKWKAAETQAKETSDRLAALQAQIDGKEAEHKAAQETQRSIKDEALAAANQRILKAEVRAAAAGKLNDPTDALAHIDLSSFEVGDDGAVDADAIGSAISDLITRKPYLAAQGGRFQGSADGGARKDTQKSQAELAAEAAAKGDHRTAAVLKADQLIELSKTVR